jgi:hypothetical protein
MSNIPDPESIPPNKPPTFPGRFTQIISSLLDSKSANTNAPIEDPIITFISKRTYTKHFDISTVSSIRKSVEGQHIHAKHLNQLSVDRLANSGPMPTNSQFLPNENFGIQIDMQPADT